MGGVPLPLVIGCFKGKSIIFGGSPTWTLPRNVGVSQNQGCASFRGSSLSATRAWGVWCFPWALSSPSIWAEKKGQAVIFRSSSHQIERLISSQQVGYIWVNPGTNPEPSGVRLKTDSFPSNLNPLHAKCAGLLHFFRSDDLPTGRARQAGLLPKGKLCLRLNSGAEVKLGRREKGNSTYNTEQAAENHVGIIPSTGRVFTIRRQPLRVCMDRWEL